jgi:hypothetical protein
MKKFILSLLLVYTVFSTYAQKAEIFIDKVDGDGFRTIVTEPINCRNGMSDRHPMSFSILCCAHGDKAIWSLEVGFFDTSPFRINKGAIMLIKLNDGSILELNQTKDPEDVEDVVGKYNSAAGIWTYTMHASYEITPDQLVRIGKTGVVKIRVERSADTFDIEYKKDKVGPAILNSYMLVAATLNTPKDLRSDF